MKIEMYQKKQIFKHPSVYNINEIYVNDKVKKTKESHYYKTNINTNDINISNIFEKISKEKWVEYE